MKEKFLDNRNFLLVAALIPIMAYFVVATFFNDTNGEYYNPFFFFSVLLTLVYLLGVIFHNKYARWSALLVFVFSIYVILMTSIISARFGETPLYPHDGSRTLEVAARALFRGENPYSITYFEYLPQAEVLHTIDGNTILNVGLIHFVYLPGHIVLTALIQLPMEALLGWFDIRIFNWLFFMTCSGLLIWQRRKKEFESQLFLLLFFLNPLFFPFMLEGRGEALLLALLIIILFALERKKFYLSAVLFGFAIAFRQTFWFLVPFVFLFLKDNLLPKTHVRSKMANWFFVSSVVAALFILPFFFWSPRDFIADTIHYPAGTMDTSYPINGFGLGTFLYQLGVIEGVTDYFPFWLPQLLICLPLLVMLLRWQAKENTLSRMVLGYSIWICSYWLLARFFHHNYLGYVLQMILLAWFWSTESRQKVSMN